MVQKTELKYYKNTRRYKSIDIINATHTVQISLKPIIKIVYNFFFFCNRILIQR